MINMYKKRVTKYSIVLLIFAIGFSKILNAKTFTFCSAASPSSLNPQLAVDGSTFTATSKTMFNRLVDFKTEGTDLVPSLAESWTVSKDGLNYTFQLKKNIWFHSTSKFTPKRPFNADDILFTFNRMRQKTHPFHNVGGATYEYFNSMSMGRIIKNIIKVNDHKVIFILRKPEAPFLANLAMDFASIHSAEYAEQLLRQKRPEALDLQPVGTGPFVLKQYKKNRFLSFRAHPKYFKGKAKIDRLIISITPEAQQRYKKLKAGQCDLISDPLPQDIAKLKTDSKVTVLQKQGLNISYLSMNTSSKPLTDVRVRRAIHHALDRNQYINTVYYGYAQKAVNPIPPAMWGYNNDVTDWHFNKAKAKQLLKEAGYKKGFEIELWTLPVSRPYNPNGQRMGELMKKDLADVGIRVKLVKHSWKNFLEKASRGEHQLLQFGWTTDNGDPDNFLNSLLSCDAVKGGNNYSRWCFRAFDKVVRKAKETLQRERRIVFYREAQKLFKEQVPWVTLAHTMVFRAMRSNVMGYEISRFGTDDFYNVDLK